MPETTSRTHGDEFTGQMMGSINSMLVEVMSAISCQGSKQRSQHQAQGIDKAKAEGKYQMRPVDADLHKRKRALLIAEQRSGKTASATIKKCPQGCFLCLQKTCSASVAAAGVRKLRCASRGVSGKPQ